jgi:hypothetical protein
VAPGRVAFDGGDEVVPALSPALLGDQPGLVVLVEDDRHRGIDVQLADLTDNLLHALRVAHAVAVQRSAGSRAMNGPSVLLRL